MKNIEEQEFDINKPIILADTSILDLEHDGIRYRPIPKEIHHNCLKKVAETLSQQLGLKLFISDHNQIVFSDLKNLEKKFQTGEVNKNVDLFIDQFRVEWKESLYTELDKIGGYKLFNRSIIEFEDKLENDSLTFNY